MSEPDSIDVHDLLAQHSWVQRLARGLVRDPAAADDLAQEAWMVAARDPARPRDLRAFLGGVVRRLASVRRRSEGRRERRERQAARPEALPSPAALLERLELQRLLLESVQELEAHERTAIQLRFFEDLSAEEIARRSGEPSATVRSRLHRGLTHLRARLDQRVDRRDLLAGLLVLARLEPGVPGAGPLPDASLPLPAPWIGALAMKSLSAVLVTVAALATGLWFVTRDEPTPRRAEAARPEAVAGVATPLSEPLHESAVAPAVEALRREALTVSEASPVVAPAAVAPVAARAHLTARVVDEQGLGLAGVALLRSDEDLARTVPGGALELEIPASGEGSTRLELRRPGYARRTLWARLPPGAEVALGEIVLRAAGSVHGWVEDELGRPIAGALVRATGLEGQRSDPEQLRRRGPEPDEHTVETRTDAEGRFLLADVPLGPTRVWAGAQERAWSSVGPHRVERDGPGPDLRLVLEPLERLDRITGLVLDPAGIPVPGARVQTWFMAATYGTGSFLFCDAAGRFEIVLQERVAHDLTISDPENRWAEIYWPGVEPGTRDLELQFQPARWLLVHVADGDGEPVEEVELALAAVDTGLTMRTVHELLGARRHEGEEAGTGTSDPEDSSDFRLRVPGATFRVEARARGFATAMTGPFEPAQAPDAIELVLEPLPGIHGRVLTAEGTPATGARVTLLTRVSDLLVQESNGFRVLTDPYPSDQTSTDGQGRFTLFPPSEHGGRLVSDQLVLRAEAPGHARTELAPRAYPLDEGVQVELRLVRGGAIEGRAETAPGVDPTGFVVAFSRADGRVQTLRLGRDGHYRQDGLTPGPWEVRVLDEEPDGASSSSSSTHYGGRPAPSMVWSCSVVDGQTTVHDLDLTDRTPCTLRGRLVLAGRDLSGWTAAFEVDGPGLDVQVLATCPLDAGGRFTLVVPRAGDHELVLRGPDEGCGRLELSETLELGPGDSDWALELTPSRLEGAGALGLGARERFHVYQWTGRVEGHDLQARVRLVPDAQGRFVLPSVPPGPGRIQRNDPPADGQRIAPWETVLEFEVLPGATRVVTLP